MVPRPDGSRWDSARPTDQARRRRRRIARRCWVAAALPRAHLVVDAKDDAATSARAEHVLRRRVGGAASCHHSDVQRRIVAALHLVQRAVVRAVQRAGDAVGRNARRAGGAVDVARALRGGRYQRGAGNGRCRCTAKYLWHWGQGKRSSQTATTRVLTRRIRCGVRRPPPGPLRRRAGAPATGGHGGTEWSAQAASGRLLLTRSRHSATRSAKARRATARGGGSPTLCCNDCALSTLTAKLGLCGCRGTAKPHAADGLGVGLRWCWRGRAGLHCSVSATPVVVVCGVGSAKRHTFRCHGSDAMRVQVQAAPRSRVYAGRCILHRRYMLPSSRLCDLQQPLHHLALRRDFRVCCLQGPRQVSGHALSSRLASISPATCRFGEARRHAPYLRLRRSTQRATVQSGPCSGAPLRASAVIVDSQWCHRGLAASGDLVPSACAAGGHTGIGARISAIEARPQPTYDDVVITVRGRKRQSVRAVALAAPWRWCSGWVRGKGEAEAEGARLAVPTATCNTVSTTRRLGDAVVLASHCATDGGRAWKAAGSCLGWRPLRWQLNSRCFRCCLQV